MVGRWMGILLPVCLLGCGPEVDSLPALDKQVEKLLEIEAGTFRIIGGPPASGAPQCTLDHRQDYRAKACLLIVPTSSASEPNTYQIYTASSSRGDCIKAVDDAAGKRMSVGTTCE